MDVGCVGKAQCMVCARNDEVGCVEPERKFAIAACSIAAKEGRW